jgi:hypothetical protein
VKWVKEVRFGQPHWFSGVYKITSYRWHNNSEVPVYYQVYRTCASGQWGDFVDAALQHHKCPTLAECKAMAEADAKQWPATTRQINKAQTSRDRWMDREVAV